MSKMITRSVGAKITYHITEESTKLTPNPEGWYALITRAYIGELKVYETKRSGIRGKKKAEEALAEAAKTTEAVRCKVERLTE